MTMRKLLLSIVAGATVAPALQAHAQVRAAVEPAIRNTRFSEYNLAGERIVRESGWLPGIGAMLEYRQDGLEIFGVANTFRSGIDYDGKLQNGTRYTTETGTQLSRVQVGVRYLLSMDMRAVVGLEYDSWKRNIKGNGTVIGLRERSWSPRFFMGIEKKWTPSDSGTFAANAMLVRAGREHVNIHFSGLLDDASIRTRPATGYALELRHAPIAAPNLHIGAYFETMRVARSPSHPVARNGRAAGEITQPEHLRQSITLFARYQF